MSGSAVADAAALGKLQIPAMLRDGYSKRFALGVTGSAALIAPVMPPSIPAVIYAGLAAVSTGALFAASVVPALLMAVGLCVVVFLWVRRDDNIQRTEFSWRRVWETGTPRDRAAGRAGHHPRRHPRRLLHADRGGGRRRGVHGGAGLRLPARCGCATCRRCSSRRC